MAHGEHCSGHIARGALRVDVDVEAQSSFEASQTQYPKWIVGKDIDRSFVGTPRNAQNATFQIAEPVEWIDDFARYRRSHRIYRQVAAFEVER